MISNVSPAQRVRNGLVVLIAIFVVATYCYRTYGDYDWSEAVWMVVVTISSVGYSETPSSPPVVQWISIGVILFGMTAAAYTFGGMVRIMVEGELDRALGSRRLTRDINKLRNHVIVCGYGRIGQELTQNLHSLGHDFVVIDTDKKRLELANQREHLAYNGDATADDVLKAVGVTNASTLVSALPSDAHNVFITLTARNLNPNLQIIARAEHVSTETKLNQAGADRVVTPAITGARQMARMITRPTTADFLDLFSDSNSIDLELDEIKIDESLSIAGKKVHELAMTKSQGFIVVAIKKTDGDIIFNPPNDHVVAIGETLIVLGHGDDVVKMHDDVRKS